MEPTTAWQCLRFRVSSIWRNILAVSDSISLPESTSSKKYMITCKCLDSLQKDSWWNTEVRQSQIITTS